MTSTIFNIFNNTSFKESIDKYFQLGVELRLIPKNGVIQNDDALISLQRLYNMDNVYRNDIFHTIDLLHKSALEKERNSLLYLILGEMVCYWSIHEYSMLRKLQDYIRNVEYSSTWWDRNKKEIATIAGGILAGAMMLAGGGGASVGGAAVTGGNSVGECVDDHTKWESEFNQLKNAILSINFNIK